MKLIIRVVGVLLLASFVFLVAGVVATWAPDKSVQALAQRWAPAPSQFLAVNGMQVHVRDEGPREDPVPVVLLHGTSASLHTWDGWAQTLRGEHRVVRFDLPAFGLTGPAPDADYSIQAYVRFVGQMLDALGIEHCVLVGNSLGGQIAWSVALALPDRVKKLVLVDAAGYPFEPSAVPLGFTIARLAGVRKLMEFVLPRGVVESSVRSVYGDPSKVTVEMVDRYVDMTLRSGNRKALALRMDQPLSGAENSIKNLKQPTLVLWGAADRLIPPESARRFAADIAGAQLVVFDGLGHVPHEEDPGKTVKVLLQFLNR